MTTKKDFIRRAMMLRPTRKEWKNYINKAIASGCLPSFDEMADNFRDVYPLAGAIFEKNAEECLCGSVDERERRRARRAANNIKCFI